MGDITCPQCGWRNEPTALMCGGCGQPLRVPGSIWDTAERSLTRSVPPPEDAPPRWDVADAPPAGTLRAPVAPRPTARMAAARPPTTRPSTTRPRAARGGCGRALFGLALMLGILLGLVAAAWALVIRPPLHARADDAIGAGLDGAVAALPAIEGDDLQATGSHITVTDAQVDAVLARDLPQGMGIDRLTVSFAPGVVLLHYSAGGWGGTISTSPRVRGGDLVATQTHVTGILGWVESGPELEATANRSLAGLRAKTPAGFQMVSASQGALSVALNT